MNIKAKEKQNIHIGLLDDNNRSTITAKLMKQRINHIKLTLLDLQSTWPEMEDMSEYVKL